MTLHFKPDWFRNHSYQTFELHNKDKTNKLKHVMNHDDCDVYKYDFIRNNIRFSIYPMLRSLSSHYVIINKVIYGENTFSREYKKISTCKKLAQVYWPTVFIAMSVNLLLYFI